jgi:hypothetical protein
MNRHPDDGDDHLATPQEAVQEYARNAGADHPEQAWLLHDWDVWVRNPHYRGPPVRHPEDYDAEEAENLTEEARDKAARRADPPEPFKIDDDLPF